MAPVAALLLLAAGTPASAVGAAPPPVHDNSPVMRVRWLMGTLCEMTAFGEDAPAALTSAFDEIGRLERILSTFIEDSEVSGLNRSKGAQEVPVSADLWDILARSLEIARLSGGSFDPTFASAPGSRGYAGVKMFPERRAVSLAPGVRLDFGAIGKGYALDAASRVLREEGIGSAFINFGGQTLAFGSPPEGGAWPIQVAAPGDCGDDRCPSVLKLRLSGRSVSTSGLSERPGHILDPRTGAEVKNKGSVTVIAASAAEADAWSTALFVSKSERTLSGFTGCAIHLSPDSGAGSSRIVFAGDCTAYLDKDADSSATETEL